MDHSTPFNGLRILGLSFLITLATHAAEPNPLGVFNFDFERLGGNAQEQVKSLKTMGFGGVTLQFRGRRQQVAQPFAAMHKATQAHGMKIHAAHLPHKIDPSKPAVPNLEWNLKLLKSVDADFWLILRAQGQRPVPRKLLLKHINAITDQCANMGERCVLYPHDNCLIESAEEAVAVVKELKLRDLPITLHLCHEIRAGNGARLKEVAAAVKPYIHLASISGANRKYVDNGRDRSHSIQPLDKGDYDAGQFIDAIQSIGYKGLIILHTFGLQRAKADHHQRSPEAIRKLYR